MNTAVLIRQATPEEVSVWDDIVSRFDNYRIFHKRSWIKYIEAFSGAQPLYLLFDKGGEIIACLPGFLVKVAWLRIFASPLEGWQTGSMGPVFDPTRISTREIFNALIPFLERHYSIHHMELACAHLDHEVMEDFGYRGERLFTYRIRLFPGEEEQAMRNIKSKTRNQLRKAIKLGLIAKIESEESFVDEFYDQVREVFARRGNIVPFSRKRALQLFQYMKDAGNLLAISIRMPDDGARIATGMFLIEGPELYLWNWTHRTRYRWYCPTELLTWMAMQKGMEAGCTTFDMAGSGDAKAKFGAVPDETVYRWIRSRYQWLASLRTMARKVFKWQQSFRGRIVRRRIFGVQEQFVGREATERLEDSMN